MNRRGHITSLDKLITSLDTCDRRSNCFNDIMRMSRIPLESLTRFVHFSPAHYTRNLVFRTLDYELVVKCWEPGQASEIRDHNGQEGWTVILQGELHEQRFSRATLGGSIKPVGDTRLRTGSLSYIHDNLGLRRMINNGDQRAISFHLFVLPIESYNAYGEITGETERVHPRYDTHGGVIL